MKRSTFFASLASQLISLTATPAYAAVFGEEPRVGTQYTIQKVFDILVGLACWFTRISIVIMVGWLVLISIQILLSRGNTEGYASGLKSLRFALLGILIIMSTYVLIATIANFAGANISALPISCTSR